MNVIIMGRQMLMQLAKKPFAEGTAVISITDSENEDVDMENLPERILRMKFDDVSDEIFENLLGSSPTAAQMQQLAGRFCILNHAQARQMADFILETGEAETLICQCEYGQSRSAAVAAAVLEYYDGKGIQVFADARYCPNKYVFRKLLMALCTHKGNVL